MTLLLRRFRPPPPLTLRRIGPDARLAALPATPAPAPVAVAVAVGPAGAAGAAGAAGVSGATGAPGPAWQPSRFDFVNAATWIAAHSLGREPGVIVFLAGGEWVVGDVAATTINFTVTHAQPQTGFVLLI